MAAPDTDDVQQALIAACEQLVRAAEEREITMGDPSSLMEKRWQLAESARRARIAISNARAASNGPRTGLTLVPKHAKMSSQEQEAQ